MVTQIVALIAELVGIRLSAAVIGGVFCVVPATPVLGRAAVAAMLVLTVLTTLRAPVDSLRGSVAGMAPLIALIPRVLRSARQMMLAVYARMQAGRLGDDLTAAVATGLAFAFPVTTIGLTVLAILVAVLSGQPHGTFDQVVIVADLLTQTIFIAWSRSSSSGGFGPGCGRIDVSRRHYHATRLRQRHPAPT